MESKDRKSFLGVRGYFSFLLVLGFAAAYLLISQQALSGQERSIQTQSLLFKAEQASLIRSALEHSLDGQIKHGLCEQPMTVDRDVIQSRVIDSIQSFISDAETEYAFNPRVRFFLAQGFGGDYSHLDSFSRTPVSREGLARTQRILAKVIVPEPLTVQLTFTVSSGIQQEILYAVIEYPDYNQFMALPPSYTRSVTVSEGVCV